MGAERLFVKVTDSVPVSLWAPASQAMLNVYA
jgi:hypothetical protein